MQRRGAYVWTVRWNNMENIWDESVLGIRVDPMRESGLSPGFYIGDGTEAAKVHFFLKKVDDPFSRGP